MLLPAELLLLLTLLLLQQRSLHLLPARPKRYRRHYGPVLVVASISFWVPASACAEYSCTEYGVLGIPSTCLLATDRPTVDRLL